MPSEQSNTPAFSLEDIDRIIHSPARLLIMKLLFVLDGADMVFLKTESGLTWGNLSVQIRNLENAGYVVVEKEFVDNKPHTVISLSREGIAAFSAYRDHLREILG
jgi:DNA-binding MarR family transcriptional regulator